MSKISERKSVRTLPTFSGVSAVVRDQTEHQSNKKNYTGIAPSKSRPKNSDPIMPMVMSVKSYFIFLSSTLKELINCWLQFFFEVP